MAGFWSIIVPEATTNLITNPSIEVDTTGFTAVGGSVARDTGQQKREVASLKITPTAGVNDGVYWGTVSLTTGKSYTFSVDIKGTDGEPYTIYFANTGGTKQGSSTDFVGTGDWQRVEVTWACNSTASYRLYVTKDNDNNTDAFYIDGLLCENLAYTTTYVDGNQEGCKWTGAEHSSTSERDAQSRLGGRVYNLDDYGFYIEDSPGIGMPPILHQTQEQPMLPGSLLRGFKTKPRVFDLIANQIGTTHEDLHSKRKDLLNAIKPDLVLEPQPFILRYTGANSEKPIEIRCVYDSGYQFTRMDGFTERDLPLRFIAYDEPYFYEIGDVAKVLSEVSSLSVSYIVAKISGQYENFGGVVNATNNTVKSIVKNQVDGNIYACGNFTSCGAITVNYVAKWNGSAWSALGTGLGSNCNDLVVDAAGNLYACGSFTTAGGNSANRIAKWNGSAWSALGTGLNGIAYDIAIDPTTGDLIVVGDFTTAGGSSANRVARWDGSSWSQIDSTTFDSAINTVAVTLDGNIYVGGGFTTPESRIAFWNGSSWADLDSGSNNQINVIHIADDGLIYAGGDFTTIGGDSINRIAVWNGKIWYGLGDDGANDSVYSIGTNINLVYVGGKFTQIGGLDLADRIGMWNGSTWAHLDIDFPGSAQVEEVVFYDNDYYIGFTTSGTGYISYYNTVTNNGTKAAYPKIVFERSGGTTADLGYLKNETSGATLYFDYSLLDGEKLTIDLTEGNRSVESSLFGNVLYAILRNSNFADFYLLPGDNFVNLYIPTTGSPTITAYMQWRDTHWSADGVAT